MKYLLLLLVIGLLVSPLLAAWPRPQQRQRERLRLQSMATGIRVELSDAPGTEQRTPNVAGPQGAWYCAELEPPVARRVLSWRSEDDGWHCQYCEGLEQAELLQLLDSLPAAVRALGIENREVKLWWPERGSEEDFRSVCNTVFQLRDRLSAGRS